MKLSILIPSLIERAQSSAELSQHLHTQLHTLNYQNEVEILKDLRAPEVASIGTKRNALLKRATGEYVVQIDDDDKVSNDYLKHIFEGINSKVDCCSLAGWITVNGGNPKIFEHSIRYTSWKENKLDDGAKYADNYINYERYPNHLNCIRTEIARQFIFPESNFGEDKVWSDTLFASGLLKTEHYIPEIIYYYQYLSKKTHK